MPQMLKNIRIIEAPWGAYEKTLRDIRTQVFIEEQGVSHDDEWDNLDNNAQHLLLLAQNIPIGCARLLTDNSNSPQLSRLKIGRIAILKPYRATGLGRQLMCHIEHIAQCKQIDLLVLDAQCYCETFYSKLGYQRVGQPFMDAGIAHQHMIKSVH